jgi:hypothetical protein
MHSSEDVQSWSTFGGGPAGTPHPRHGNTGGGFPVPFQNSHFLSVFGEAEISTVARTGGADSK